MSATLISLLSIEQSIEAACQPKFSEYAGHFGGRLTKLCLTSPRPVLLSRLYITPSCRLQNEGSTMSDNPDRIMLDAGMDNVTHMPFDAQETANGSPEVMSNLDSLNVPATPAAGGAEVAMLDSSGPIMLDEVRNMMPHRSPDGQDTASSSGWAEDLSDVFDFHKYYDSNSETDVTTPPSEGDAAGTSLLPTQGTTPAENPSHVEDTPMSDAPGQDPHHSNIWPKLSDAQPPREINLSLDPSSPPQLSGEMSPEGPSQVRPASGQKTRHIKDLDKTNKVRERGACYHCRINKKSVSDLRAFLHQRSR